MATLGGLGLVAAGLFWFVPLARFVSALRSRDAELHALGLCGTLMVVGYLHFGLTLGLLFQHVTFLGFYLVSAMTLLVLIDRIQHAPADGGAPA